MRILAVDDDTVFLKLLKAVLSDAGYDAVTTADSAKNALEILSETKEPFECLLLDIKMPGMNGIELCREIRALADYSNAPILMLTALTDDTSIEQAFAAGANDYITKPLHGLELGSRIRLAAQLCELRERDRRLLQSRALTGRPSAHAPEIQRTSVVPLSEVFGVVDYLELENYLLRSEDDVTALRMFALALPNLEKQLNRANEFEFHDLLREMAVAVSRTTSSPNSLIACPDGNVLLFVSKGWHRVFVPAVNAAAREVLVEWFGETAGNRIDLHVCLERTTNQTKLSGRRAAERLRKLAVQASEELGTQTMQRRLQFFRDYEPEQHPLHSFFSIQKILPRRVSRAFA